ncbi:MAG: glycosyltransferase [Prevotellaceae bacterium]|jgi:glycosyltransferase involved in cell wall biosynthesis|nr:glycosyltransferase [Prevotellaceae bacterium]
MKNPKISVIIPCYNGEKYIAQCLENVMCQTYRNLEIIVVNDGSKDNSLEIIQKFKDLIIINQENRGLSAARNTGIDHATGDYIHFFDVDDFINLEFYEKMAEAIALTDAEIACSGMINEPKPRRTRLYPILLVLTNTEDKISTTNVGRHGYVWRYLFKKSFLIKQNLRFETGVLVEDLPFSLQAVYFANKIVTVPDAIYFYKRRENSILTTKNRKGKKKRHEGWLIAKKFRMEFSDKHNFKIQGVNSSKLARLNDRFFA